MAKIKQVKMRLGLTLGRPNQETVIAINYNSTDQHTTTYRRRIPPENERFFIRLPKVVADALGVEQALAGDQDEVVVKFRELIEQYKCLATEVNQVILYIIQVAPDSVDKRSAFSHGHLSVDVWAGTYEETVAVAGDGGKRYSYTRVESPVNFTEGDGGKVFYDPTDRRGVARFDCQAPWNERNASFFLWIKEHMLELVARLGELRDADKMIETINADRLLPLLASPDTAKESEQ
ncbi:hypothetical protein LCGC14_0510200 [marine sediment metagenome]|uniref:Uncharacterized protein n=1 Tax=marine sediment metagenome TaxID=412755 RepID=A0A0F9S682_9ZZZZ